MKKRTIFQILLGLVSIGLAVWLYLSIMQPVKFDNEYTTRRDACAEKLKAIRTLEEAYKSTYGCYTGSFDTLINRLLNEDSLRISKKIYHPEKYPNDPDFSISDLSDAEAIKLGYMNLETVHVNPIAQLREEGKLFYKDADGEKHEISDQEIMDIAKVPYPKDSDLKFTLQAGKIMKGGFEVPVFECRVDFKDLLSDLPEQDVANKIAAVIGVNKEPCWKVGDMTQSITDGNFE